MVVETISHLDGRFARGERSRKAVAAALLDLLEEGVVEPTANEIAARAKVSGRLVFHHFSDLESLLATAAELQMNRLLPTIEMVDPALPLESRIVELVRKRAKFYERISPVRRAALRREPFSTQIANALVTAHELARNLTHAAFSRELSALPPDDSTGVFHALNAITSWDNWEYLRRRERLSIEATSRTIERMLRSLMRKAVPAVKASRSRGRRKAT